MYDSAHLIPELNAAHPLWTEMVRHELDEYLQVVTIETYNTDEEVFNPRSLDQSLYLVHHGSVRAYVCSDNGRPRFSQVYSPGDVFGPILWGSQVQENFVRTDGDVVLARVNLIGFKRLMQACPSTCFGLFRYAAASKEEGERQYERLLQSRAKERVVHVLLGISDRLGLHNSERFSIAPFTHQDIAQLAGLRRTTVSEIVSELRLEGVIEGGSRGFNVIRSEASRMIQA